MYTRHFGSYALAMSIAACMAAGCETTKPNPSSNEDVVVAFDALSGAIAACGGDLGTCSAEAAGDAAALQACNDAFAGCQQTAGGPAAGALSDGVVACTEAMRTCASSAGDAGASGCHEELQTCLGASLPSPPEHAAADAAASGDHVAPVRSCIDELIACVTGDGNPMDCALAVRACIIANVPAPPGVIPEDPGSAAGDAGRPDDLPEPPADAGMPGDLPEPPTPDAGMAGEPPAASCMEAFDACVSAGGTTQDCAKAQRDCER